MPPDLTATALSADPMLQWEYGGAGGVFPLPSMAQSTTFSKPDNRPKYSIPGLGEIRSEPSPFAPQSQPQQQPSLTSEPMNVADPQFEGSTTPRDTSVQELASMMSSSTGQSQAELQDILCQLQNFSPLPAFGGHEIPTYNPGGSFGGQVTQRGQPFPAEGDVSQAGEEWRSYVDDNGISPTVIPDWNGGIPFS